MKIRLNRDRDRALYDLASEAAGCDGVVYLDLTSAEISLCDGSDLVLWRGRVCIDHGYPRMLMSKEPDIRMVRCVLRGYEDCPAKIPEACICYQYQKCPVPGPDRNVYEQLYRKKYGEVPSP